MPHMHIFSFLALSLHSQPIARDPGQVLGTGGELSFDVIRKDDIMMSSHWVCFRSYKMRSSHQFTVACRLTGGPGCTADPNGNDPISGEAPVRTTVPVEFLYR